MTYYLYHIPGKKIGVTRDLKERVERQQGYDEGEYTILMESDDIQKISNAEIEMQKAFGYKVDTVPYNKLKFNKMEMNINVTEQTTTFPCPVKKLKSRLMEHVGMKWTTIDGDVHLTPESIRWIEQNAKTSMYNNERSYVYNKAFARWFDNNDMYPRTGALAPTRDRNIHASHFDLIRKWAEDRGLYKGGDTKTQSLKLVEEVGEICRAILKDNHSDIEDGIGDAVVVLTNLAELQGTSIEACIERAYNEIKDRTGKMDNGTFKKD
jgi:NTP pyrophosphatase (non-canonical NTP hydrolase)